jgi:hypothetical protein
MAFIYTTTKNPIKMMNDKISQVETPTEKPGFEDHVLANQEDFLLSFDPQSLGFILYSAKNWTFLND